MQHETVSTPPSQGSVFCSPPLARAHVDCRNYRRQTGYKYISCSQTTGAGAHAREAIADRAAYFKAWRTAKWGGEQDADIVAVAEPPTARLVAGNPRRGGDGALPSRECLRARRLCTSPQPELAEDRVEETDFLQKAKKGENSFEHCKHWTKTTLHGRRGA